MQGESDALQQDTADAYQTNLSQFLLSLRSDLGLPVLPITAGLISTQGEWPFVDTVRNSTALTSVLLGQVAVVETNDLPTFTNNLAHYNSQGNLLLGQRFADVAASLLPDQWHFPGAFGQAQGDNYFTYRERGTDGVSLMTFDPANNRWFGKEAGEFIGDGWMHPGAAKQAALALK
jgi:hypothetical protein